MTSRPRAVVVGVQLDGTTEDEHLSSLDELTRLGETLGLEVIGRVTQRRPALAKGSVVGRGKLRELAAWTGGTGVIPSPAPKAKPKAGPAIEDEVDEPAEDDEPEDDTPLAPDLPEPIEAATTVLVDHDLTPSQARNLEKATEAEVMDRTAVILAIFHRHARSREARLQVEIAELNYLIPRLRESTQQRSQGRQRGGGRGSGQSAHELDKRNVRDRIAALRRELAEIEATSGERRKRRSTQPTVALVGYTNAGKSSLMRRLTGSEVYVADKLFATLDTTIRTLVPETKPRVLVSDTVGFIKKLPHDLVASFRSTLDEARDADLLLHVVDASDPAFPGQLEVTLSVLGELDALGAERWLILNKADRVDEGARWVLEQRYPDGILMSAHDPGDVASLHARIVRWLERDMQEHTLLVPYDRHALVSELHAEVRILAEDHVDEGTRVRFRATNELAQRFEAKLARRG
jgi:GTP-binding protein HflX